MAHIKSMFERMRDQMIIVIHHDDLGDILWFFVIDEFGDVLDVVVRLEPGETVTEALSLGARRHL